MQRYGVAAAISAYLSRRSKHGAGGGGVWWRNGGSAVRASGPAGKTAAANARIKYLAARMA